MPNIIIKPIKEIKDIEEAVQVQKRAWNRSDISLIPSTMMKSFINNGGCLVGAFDSEKVVGYAVGFLSINSSGLLYHHSQQVGVLPEYQNFGIAFRLKLAQKEFVKEKFNINVMSWTVDPLLAKNAMLNFHKLGAIGRIYWENYYGNRDDDLNSGLETDRIEVEWWFNKDDQENISTIKSSITTNIPLIDYNDNGNYNSLKNDFLLTNNYFGIQIPSNLVELKKENLSKAMNIRQQFRIMAKECIKSNYSIIDVMKINEKIYLIWTDKLKEFKRLK